MNLRDKTLIVVGSFLICLIVILYIAAQLEWQMSLSKLEQDETQRNLERGLNAISIEIASLGDLANYWAARNDTYAFATTGDPNFIQYNVASGSFTNDGLRNMGINLILFMDSYGQIKFDRYQNISGIMEEIPQDLKEQLSFYGFCPGCLDKQSKYAGIILLSNQPMLIVTQPISKNQEVPSMGRVIIGKYLTQKEMIRLSDITRLNLTMYPSSGERLPADFKQVSPILSNGIAPTVIRELDEKTISGYSLLRNIYGNPLLIFRVDTPREIYNQGTKTVHNFIILFSMAGIIFLIITLLYLDRSVLSRLSTLTDSIVDIGRSQNIASRVIVQGKDELAQLARSINAMLTALDYANIELTKSEKRYKTVVEEQSDLICRYLLDDTIIFVNKAFCIFFSKKADELIGNKINQFSYNGNMKSAEELKRKLNIDHASITYESRFIMPNGIHWILWTSHGIFDESKAIIEVQSVGREITELKIAEEALKQLQRRQADIIDFLPEALLAIDLDGRVIVWNKAMEELTRVKAKDMLGKSNYEYSLPFYGIRRPILADMVLNPSQGFEREYTNFLKEGLTVFGETYIPTFGKKGSYLLAKATALYDDDGNVIGAIESVRDMTERRKMEQKLERSRTELHIAAEIQKRFIPEKTPFIENFEVAAMTIPATEVGGDFYDFISLPDDKNGIVIADVAGKGVPAALFMALSRTIIRANATQRYKISEILKNANNMIAAEAVSGMFVTLLYGVLDQEARIFKYADAGHPPPLLIRSATCGLEQGDITGLVLGVNEGEEYEERIIKFSPGDIAILYTDGVTESMNSSGELYGLERFADISSKFCQDSAGELIKAVLNDISNFRGGEEQNDDITIMVLKATEHEEDAHSQIIISAKIDEIPKVTTYVDEILTHAGLEKEKILEVQLAVEEACINIIQHGYSGAEGTIFISSDLMVDYARITIEDNAPPFDPTQFRKPNLDNDLDKRPIGGLGIHLIRSSIDEFRYEFKDGKNKLTLIKRRT